MPWTLGLLLTVVVICGLLFASGEAGFRWGRRQLVREGQDADKGLGVIEGAVFALLGGMALTAMAVVLFWQHGPATVLLGLACIHGVVAVILWRRASLLLRDWRTFPASLDQLRQDRAKTADPQGLN